MFETPPVLTSSMGFIFGVYVFYFICDTRHTHTLVLPWLVSTWPNRLGSSAVVVYTPEQGHSILRKGWLCFVCYLNMDSSYHPPVRAGGGTLAVCEGD